MKIALKASCLFLLLAACGDDPSPPHRPGEATRADALAGTWVLDLERSHVGEAGAVELAARVTGQSQARAGLQLVLAERGTFELISGEGAEPFVVEGRWSQDGADLLLVNERAAGQALQEELRVPERYRFEAGRLVLELGEQRIVLRREPPR